MKYLVSHQGQEAGPFGLEDIVSKVRNKELDLFDYIFVEDKQDWILLMEHPELGQLLKSNKPPQPPRIASTQKPNTVSNVTKDAHAIAEWFILKGENRFGPFAYTDVVKMLQQKVVFPFDFIWHAGLDRWKRVAELNDFTEDHIRGLFAATETNKKDVFVERQFKRQKFGGRVIIHDNLTLWKGEGFEISQGGVGVTMKNPLVVPGQQVFVHFQGQGQFPAFNAVCEVVSKKFIDDDGPIQYGLRFLSLSQEVKEEFFKRVM